jgi:molecular chaperone DnaJ
MEEVICPLCHGRGGDVTIKCRNCNGTGYDPEEDNPFAQCHTCYGDEEEEVEVCPRCGGEGKIYLDEDDEDEDDEDEDTNW